MENQIKKSQKSIANFLSTPKTAEFLTELLKTKKSAFVSNLIALSNEDASLAKCDPKDLMMCALNATSLDLALNKNLGYAYVIAYKNNKLGKYEPTFQIGARGFKQLAMRSGQYRTFNYIEIREGELRYNKFSGHFEILGNYPENKIVGYLSHFELMNGFSKSLYMTNQDLENHALRYSKAYQNDIRYGTKRSKWSTEERHEMCLKTVIKLLLSRDGILSTEMITAMTHAEVEEAEDTYFEDVTKTEVSREVIEQNEEEIIEI